MKEIKTQWTCVRTDEGVSILWAGGTFKIEGRVFQKWSDSGGSKRWWPLGDVVISSDRATHIQHFIEPETGKLASICSHLELGAWWMTDSIRDKWYQLGAETGYLGLPVEDEMLCSDDEALIQSFRQPGSNIVSGVIIYAPGNVTFEVHGEIYKLWAASGCEKVVGLPECDTLKCGDGRGCYNQFYGSVRSRIYWTAAYGAILIRDPIFSVWYDLGAERGALSYPASGEEIGPVPNSLQMRFEKGAILLSPDGRIQIRYQETADETV